MNRRKKVTTIILIIMFIALGILVKSYIAENNALPLGIQLANKGVSEALVFASQALDEMPRWSADGESIYVNEAGVWKRIDLNRVQLRVGHWRNESLIGIAHNMNIEKVIIEDVPPESIQKNAHRKITTSDGTAIELLQSDTSLGVTLVISEQNQPQETVWKSDLENCHSLALSPNETYVAYQCELNGLIVRKL